MDHDDYADMLEKLVPEIRRLGKATKQSTIKDITKCGTRPARTLTYGGPTSGVPSEAWEGAVGTSVAPAAGSRCASDRSSCGQACELGGRHCPPVVRHHTPAVMRRDVARRHRRRRRAGRRAATRRSGRCAPARCRRRAARRWTAPSAAPAPAGARNVLSRVAVFPRARRAAMVAVSLPALARCCGRTAESWFVPGPGAR